MHSPDRQPAPPTSEREVLGPRRLRDQGAAVGPSGSGKEPPRQPEQGDGQAAPAQEECGGSTPTTPQESKCKSTIVITVHDSSTSCKFWSCSLDTCCGIEQDRPKTLDVLEKGTEYYNKDNNENQTKKNYCAALSFPS